MREQLEIDSNSFAAVCLAVRQGVAHSAGQGDAVEAPGFETSISLQESGAAPSSMSRCLSLLLRLGKKQRPHQASQVQDSERDCLALVIKRPRTLHTSQSCRVWSLVRAFYLQLQISHSTTCP